MTLLFSHDVRLLAQAAANRFTLGRTIKRIRAAFRMIHRAIAAAKIHRLRNELLLHRGHEDATRYPRQPVVLGEKWDH
jgi:hypothetical protein